jgi:hypothetical protein
MVSLPCNLMIRRGMVPHSEGLRLHFIVNQKAGLFSAIAASSNTPFGGCGRIGANGRALVITEEAPRYVQKALKRCQFTPKRAGMDLNNN